MLAAPPNHLRRNEARGAAKRPARRTPVGPEPLCEPEVRDFDAHVRVKKNIRRLDVAVQHALVMDVREPVQNLPAVVLALVFGDSSSLFEDILQRLPIAATGVAGQPSTNLLEAI